MHPVGLPAIAWIPPYAAQVPIATTAHALGASRSIHWLTVIGWPVTGSLPIDVQKPSPLIRSFGIDPSTTSTNGPSRPSAASWKAAMKSLPVSAASTLLCRWTLGSPGTRPSSTSSMLGRPAAVTETVSPSQLIPSEVQRMWTSSTAASFTVSVITWPFSASRACWHNALSMTCDNAG
jgi:hypothetical protein